MAAVQPRATAGPAKLLASSQKGAMFATPAQFANALRGLRAHSKFTKAWHRQYNAVHARIPFPPRNFDASDPDEAPAFVPVAAQAERTATDDASPLAHCRVCSRAMARSRTCVRCAKGQAPADVRMAAWPHAGSDPPVFRLTKEYIARIDYLEAVLSKSGVELANQAVSMPSGDQFLQQAVKELRAVQKVEREQLKLSMEQADLYAQRCRGWDVAYKQVKALLKQRDEELVAAKENAARLEAEVLRLSKDKLVLTTAKAKARSELQAFHITLQTSKLEEGRKLQEAHRRSMEHQRRAESLKAELAQRTTERDSTAAEHREQVEQLKRTIGALQAELAHPRAGAAADSDSERDEYRLSPSSSTWGDGSASKKRSPGESAASRRLSKRAKTPSLNYVEALSTEIVLSEVHKGKVRSPRKR